MALRDAGLEMPGSTRSHLTARVPTAPAHGSLPGSFRGLSRPTSPFSSQTADAMRLGIADHFGWAVAVTASADHEVVDRRRIELVEPGVTAAPIHYESERLDVAATAALVAKVRASVVRATSAALDELAAALPAPVVSISLRAWPPDFPDDIAVQRRRRTRPAPTPSCTARCSPSSHTLVAGTSTSSTRRTWWVKRSACWVSGPTRSCRVLGRRWGHPGRRTTGWRSPRRSWPAELRRTGAAGSGFERHAALASAHSGRTRPESAVIVRLLDRARAGRAGVVVVTGEAGPKRVASVWPVPLAALVTTANAGATGIASGSNDVPADAVDRHAG